MKVIKTEVNFTPKAGDIVMNNSGEPYLIGYNSKGDFALVSLKSGYVSMDTFPTVDELIKNYMRNVTYYDGEETELKLGGSK